MFLLSLSLDSPSLYVTPTLCYPLCVLTHVISRAAQGDDTSFSLRLSDPSTGAGVKGELCVMVLPLPADHPLSTPRAERSRHPSEAAFQYEFDLRKAFPVESLLSFVSASTPTLLLGKEAYDAAVESLTALWEANPRLMLEWDDAFGEVALGSNYSRRARAGFADVGAAFLEEVRERSSRGDARGVSDSGE